MGTYEIGTRDAVIVLDGDDYSGEIAHASIESAEAQTDFVPFTAARAGGSRTYTLKIKFVQTTDTADTLSDYVWAHSGESVDCEFWPRGRPADHIATTAQPFFDGTLTVTDPDGTLVGGDADASKTNRWVVEVDWEFAAKPTKNTSGAGES